MKLIYSKISAVFASLILVACSVATSTSQQLRFVPPQSAIELYLPQASSAVLNLEDPVERNAERDGEAILFAVIGDYGNDKKSGANQKAVAEQLLFEFYSIANGGTLIDVYLVAKSDEPQSLHWGTRFL